MPRRASHPGLPWCFEHECAPDICFEEHYPGANSAKGALTEEETRLAIIREHTRKQNENIKAQQEKMSCSIVDARKQFEEAKNRNEKEAG